MSDIGIIKYRDRNDPTNLKTVYPVTTLDAVKDAATNKSLAEILTRQNDKIEGKANKIDVVLYNITQEIPLVSGFYTLTSAIVEIPNEIRNVGLEVTFESAERVWETYKFVGSNLAEWNVVDNWRSLEKSLLSKMSSDKTEIDDKLSTKADHGYDVEETKKTLKEVETLVTQNAEDITQLAGEVSLLSEAQGDADGITKSWVSTHLNSIPFYGSPEEVPEELLEPYDPDKKLPKQYIEYEGGVGDYNQNEALSNLYNTVAQLAASVARIERAFTDHMDCGTLSDSKMSSVASDQSIEAEEPLWASETGEPMDLSGVPEVPYTEPENPDIIKVKHLSIKSGKFEDLPELSNYLLPFELVWIYDTTPPRLYIKNADSTLYWINRNQYEPNPDPDPNPELPNMDELESIGFISPNGNKYKITITDDGEWNIVNQMEAQTPDSSQLETSGIYQGMSKILHLPKLYINSVYCGGIPAESPKKYQACSHNFVELSNLTGQDVSLNGLSLQYSINGTIWEVLPLSGIIKAGGTYLVRGAPCSIMEANTTRIKVKTYDLEWRNASGDLIQFSTTKCKFLLTYGTTPCPVPNPYLQDTSSSGKAYVQLGYIDMVGMNKIGATQAEAIDGYEQAPFAQLSMNDRLYMKYYAMDPVKQATKALGARKNSTDWTWVELSKDFQPNIEDYTPRSSKEGKTLFYNKTKLSEDAPNLVTVTFGRNAHTTRCFNWISVGYRDEFLWYRKQGTSEWTEVESFKSGDSRSEYTSEFYNRIRVVATDGTCFTAHKLIISGLTPGTYEYKCGSRDHQTEIYRFKVRAASTGDFSFVHHSDQQGFNWSEYEVWRKSAEWIREHENPEFTINTGDMTQNGNRISEWLDYYKAGEKLFTGKDYSDVSSEFMGVEQMNCIGNNDLSPENFEELGNGSDLSKINSINFLFFYTYEMDESNPPIIEDGSGNKYFIPSLYSFDYNDCHFIVVNSEIPSKAQEILYNNLDVYEFMRQWCDTDLSSTSKKWKIAVCHEMPFTIITRALINQYLADNTVSRGGSRLNTETSSENTYWFSQLLERHSVRLCLGGHKHTFSVSYPLIENITDQGEKLTMRPKIQTLDQNFEASLTEQEKLLCEVEVVPKITAPIYVMCQSTGYKQTSNKELPAPGIPWLENYFPCNVSGGTDSANSGQLYPFYIKWNVTSTQIIGTVVKLDNIMTNGKFNINQQNPNPIEALDGNGSSNSQIIINI